MDGSAWWKNNISSTIFEFFQISNDKYGFTNQITWLNSKELKAEEVVFQFEGLIAGLIEEKKQDLIKATVDVIIEAVDMVDSNV